MSQQQTPVLTQLKTAAPVGAAKQHAPLPLDPALLSQVSGGTTSNTSLPNTGW
jgi:hypothetical protein